MTYKAEPRPTNLNELRLELIRNAAFAVYEGQKAKALALWKEKDDRRRVIYVFDTDVIMTYCAPWINGPADRQGHGYGQVLPRRPLKDLATDEKQALIVDERRRAEAVAWLLASKALQVSEDLQMPVLQTNAHFEETLSIYETVKAKAGAEADASRSSAAQRQDWNLGHTLRLVRSVVDGDDDSSHIRNAGHYLSNVLKEIQARDLQNSSRFVREWDAFLDLVRRSSGIYQLSEFRPGSTVSVQEKAWNSAVELLREARNSEDPAIKALNHSFRNFAVDRKRGTGEIDREALAEVAYVNHLLREMAPNCYRVVLVTGNRTLDLDLAVSKEPLPPESSYTVADFAFDHVHHLWSFVDTIAVGLFAPRSDPEQTTTGGTLSRSELFSGLLALEDEALDDEEGARSASIDILVTNAIRAETDLTHRILRQNIDGLDIDKAYQRWEEFSDGAANLHRHFLFDPTMNEQISRILIKKLKTQDPDVDGRRLQALVVETMARARDRTNVELSEIGGNSIFAAHDHGVRNPPDLMLDGLVVTNRIFKDLALSRRVFVNAEDFSERFNRIVEDCYQPDQKNLFDDDYRQECYLKYLVLGALFATENRWIVAEQHAERAVKIVERAETLKDPIRILTPSASAEEHKVNGREAYYLLAFVSRMRARQESDYGIVEDWLQKARACLEEDHQRGAAQGVPSVRFDGESLAIALSRYYYARSKNPNDPCNEHANHIFRCAQKLLEAREAMQRNADGAANADGDKIGNLPVYTRTRIATNLIQVAVIAKFRSGRNNAGEVGSPVEPALLQGALDDLVRDTNLLSELAHVLKPEVPKFALNSPKIICSPLIMLYSVVGAMLADDRRIWSPRNENDVDHLFDTKRTNVAQYDPWRFDWLREFSKSLLSG